MLNIAALVGRLTADPELKHTSNSIPVTNFNVAVGRSFVRAGEERQTDFIDVVAWRSTAEFVAKYFKKGQLIAVEGSIQTRTYQDKDGNKRKAFEIMANNVHFVESKKDSADNSVGTGQFGDSNKSEGQAIYISGNDSDFQEIQSDNDLPF
ncbi:MAG: single-stranded DNA-binding protein [Oscillospiraceae bacterium]|jgi:single-strand DNA-binding protein|nr:single-stranded DNA-binding protein [Oscillospiraceae bacterium]